MTASAWYVTTQTRWIESVLFFILFLFWLWKQLVIDPKPIHTHTSWRHTDLELTFATRINNTHSARSRIGKWFSMFGFLICNVRYSYTKKKNTLPSFVLRPIDDRINLLDVIQRRSRRTTGKVRWQKFPFQKLGRGKENSLDANIQRHLVNWCIRVVEYKNMISSDSFIHSLCLSSYSSIRRRALSRTSIFKI